MSEIKNEQHPETQWYEVTAETFDIYGVFPEKDGILSRRVPLSVAETVSENVTSLCGYGAGGRILFSTDSSCIWLKVEYGMGEVSTVLNHCAAYGFDLYRYERNGQDTFVGAMRPPNTGFNYKSAEFCVKTRSKELGFYTINLPILAEIKRLYIGIDYGCRLERGKRYRNSKPVVFYGSSITHGAAAGRPGNIYENFISQAYNLDYRNFGFAGAAKGEKTMAEFLAGLEMCAFVSDYDHNAPSVEHLRATHYPLYETIRGKHPEIPYIMISKPDFFPDPEKNSVRRAVIQESYEKARAAGDQNVWFIDGETLFEGAFYHSCTSDGCHPNDLGFFRMAEKIGPVIMRSLGFM